MAYLTQVTVGNTTLDVGGGGGGDTEYSTTEKVVGTWIDSKPLYQKTYSTDSLSLTGTMTDIALSTIGIDNIDYINVKEAFLYTSDGYWITSPFYSSSTDFMNVSAFNLNSGNDIFRISVPANYASKYKKIRVTFQYTKTTD